VKNWKTRYVRIVLDGSSNPKSAYMSYYKTPDNGIDIHRSGAQGVVQLRRAVLDPTFSSSPGAGYNFKVTTESGVGYPFKADTESEKNVWLEHISTCIAACDGVASPSDTAAAAADLSDGAPPPSWVSKYS
jgi:hypothetical protein